MLNRAGKSEGQMNMGMFLDAVGVPAILGKLLSLSGKKPEAPKSPTGDVGASKKASDKLGKLEKSTKTDPAAKGTVSESDQLKQQQELEVAKLKQRQLGESKALYGKQESEKSALALKQKNELSAFESHQKSVKEKFLAKKPSSNQISTFEKTQAADKKSFEEKQSSEKKSLGAHHVSENIALSARFKEQNADQAKWHTMQKQELEAKHAPVVKTTPVKMTKVTAPAAKSKPVELSPVICKIGDGDIPVAKHDGVNDTLVFIPA